MEKLTIKTDNKWKPFKHRNEVPAEVLKNEFDYQNEEETQYGYIRYRGKWYHTDMFLRLQHKDTFPGKWDGSHGDSFFSGILLKVSNDGERYKIATYYS